MTVKDFDSLSQKEILALAISLEEEDERIYSDFAESLRENFPGTAQVFEEMRQEEIGHRRRLIELYKQKFGEHIPLIRRQDVRGFVQRKPIWLNTPLRLEQIRGQVSTMEAETRRFYEQAAARAQDAGIRSDGRTGNHHLGASSVYGHASIFGCHAGAPGRRAGVRHWDTDRECLAVIDRRRASFRT
jgi:rubrerythrin